MSAVLASRYDSDAIAAGVRLARQATAVGHFEAAINILTAVRHAHGDTAVDAALTGLRWVR